MPNMNSIPTQAVKRAILIAAANGMSEEEGLAIVNEVAMLMIAWRNATAGSAEDVRLEDEVTDLITEGIFTEANPMLPADLAMIGVMVKRGYVKSTAPD